MQTREWLSREVASPDVSHSDFTFVISYNIFTDPRSSVGQSILTCRIRPAYWGKSQVRILSRVLRFLYLFIIIAIQLIQSYILSRRALFRS